MTPAARTIPHLAQALGATLLARGHDGADLFRTHPFARPGATPEGGMVPFAAVLDVFEEAAALTGDDLIGLRTGAAFDVRELGLPSFIGIYSDTLGDGLRNLARVMALTGDALALDTVALADSGRLGFRWALPPHVVRRQYAECVLACLATAVTAVMHRPVRPRAVAFAHRRAAPPPDFLRVFGRAPAFGQGDDALHFAAHDLAAILPTHDGKLMAFLMEVAEDRIGRPPPNQPPLLQQVEAAILRLIGRGTPRLDDVANDLAMSPRTLTRRLQAQGTSFGEVLRQVRAYLATDYLQGSDLSQAQISILLGYADQAAFAHAYKAWTGRPPGAVRRAPS